MNLDKVFFESLMAIINERKQRFNFSLFYRSAMSFVVRSVKPVKALIFGRVDLNGHCEECQRHVRSRRGR